MFLANLKKNILSMLRDKTFWALLVVLGIAAYLRLWQIDSLFNAFDEYDEGTLALQARFIAEGHMPYRDFILVHPPGYYLALAGVFKVFGYSFFYAKYLSVALSLFSVVFIYLTGKKLYHAGAGLFAAALFAVSPDMVYIGRRIEQEPLGVFLVVLALFFAAQYINAGKKRALIWCGLVLGLALATKYLFLPALLAIPLGLAVYLAGEKTWQTLRRLARPAFVGTYALLTAGVFSAVYVLSRLADIDIPIPFMSVGGFNAGAILLSCSVFAATLFFTMRLVGEPISPLEWRRSLVAVIARREIWYLALGITTGFLLVTGYFFINAPSEFVRQTLELQGSRLLAFPSAILILSGASSAWEYLKIGFATALVPPALALGILNRKAVTPAGYFNAFIMLGAFALCQFLTGVPRYYYSGYAFMILGLAAFVPDDARLISADVKNMAAGVKISLAGLASAMLVFFSVSMALLIDYPGYDYGTPRLTNDEGYIYEKTIGYLESVSPNKVYSANPVFLALSSNLDFNLNVDTFAQLGLEKEDPETFVKNNIAAGADYFVLDYYSRSMRRTHDAYTALEKAVAENARLVQRIGESSINYVEIYRVVPDGQTILNGSFRDWADGENTIVPAGWQQVLLAGDGENDTAEIARVETGGKECVRLTATEAGSAGADRLPTSARIHQTMPFPEGILEIEILPVFDALDKEGTAGAGIIFSDGAHNLTVNFSSGVASDRFTKTADGKSATLTRPAVAGRWTTQAIDLRGLWAEAGWEPREEVDVSFFVTVMSGASGEYRLFIAGIRES